MPTFFAAPMDKFKELERARMGPYYTMKCAGTSAEILLYSDIGSDFWGEGTTAEGFAKDLKALGNVSTIDLRINSPGGNVFEGLTIYNLLASHSARIVVHIDGLAASIASVVAMAGDAINMADNGMMMIHDAWGMAIGTAADIRKTADVLDSVTGTIAATYTKRSGADPKEISKMMSAETWLTAEEAKTWGLVDAIVDNMKIAACAFDARRFKNTPITLIERLSAMPNRDRFAARFQSLQTDRVRDHLRAHRQAA
jgi:ATP-dependent Clp protease, protease subunit